MSAGAASPLQRPAVARRPSAGRLIADQLRCTLLELWRSRVVLIFTLLFPLTWLVVIGFLAGNAAVDPSSGVRIMQFVTPSAIAMGVLFGAYPTVATTLALAREQGVLKRVRGTPLPPWIYLAGRIGGAVGFALASVLVTLAVAALVYDVQILLRTLLATVVTLVVGVASFAALGLAVATLAPSAGAAQAGSIGSAVVLSFVSGLYSVGSMPAWADRVGAVFPLQPFVRALRDAFNPFHPGSGWDVGALAVSGAWALAATVVASRRFRWDPTPSRPGRGRAVPQQRAAPAGVAPARLRATAPGRPSPVALLLDQVRWATTVAWRDPGWVFFAVALPVGLYAFNLATGGEGPGGAGDPALPLTLAAGMTAWGAAVTGFINLPEAVARGRDRGELKRLRGTPLSAQAFLAGRTLSALLIVLVTAALVLAVGLALADLRISWAGLPLATAMLVLGTLTLTACGFALAAVLPDAKAMTAVGLGVLLPVSFFSEIFVPSGTPEWMATVGSFLPLAHLVDALTAALDPGGPAVDAAAVGVLTAWLVAATLLSVRRFRWVTGTDSS